MKKIDASKFLMRLFPQILVQSVAIILTAVASYMFMTWLIQDVFQFTHTYLSAFYETMGALLMMILILVSTNTYIYHKRLKEVRILSDAIERVSSGDFAYRIAVHPGDPMAQIYEDLNKMSSELGSLQMLRNDFINRYSHEFKTPIASINGFAELLLEKQLPEQEQRQYLEIIRDESERLSNLARNTILFSRLSAQQLITHTETYDLGEQLRQCSIILSKSWMEKQIDFTGNFPTLPFVGDKELIQHLWLNLIGNAVKYTPAGGEITVTLTAQGDHALVTVADNGEGMSEETQAHLFEPYYQGTSQYVSQGLGLGLSIAHRVTELCGGTIGVQSSLGLGTTFIVSLPLRENGAQGKLKVN
jgi:signal transduction histidine kinase